MSQPLLNHATATMAAGSKSFATAATLFDKDTRRSALMLYAWCRYCDDVIDDQQLGFAAAQHPDSPTQRLAGLRESTRLAYLGDAMDRPAFAALQEVSQAHAIPIQLAFDHLEGYAMDVRGEIYHTLEDTLCYCYHVAGVVGLMMAQVMGVRDIAVLDRACDLGLAFQLTNIARDLVEDARAGRCYLPTRWLAEEGLQAENYAAPANRSALARLAARLIAAAEPYYDSARAGLYGLPLRSAWAVATAHGVYRDIGTQVRHAGAEAWQQRQRTGRLNKLGRLVTGAGLALSSRASAGEARPATLWQRPYRPT